MGLARALGRVCASVCVCVRVRVCVYIYGFVRL